MALAERRALLAAVKLHRCRRAVTGECTTVTTQELNQTLARNPLVEKRADPWVLKDGATYYFTGSYPEYDRIVLRGAPTLAGLRDAEETVIWTRPQHGEMGGNIWAPELHKINDTWYFYFTAGHSEKPFRIRMYVMEGHGADPRTATWNAPQKIETEWDEFALDATVFQHNGDLYYVWAQRPIQEPGLPDGVVINSNLYISKMADPHTLIGTPTLLTTPTLDWENVGFRVNEGAAALIRNGKVFITYSASATDHHYCMGLLTADANADLLDPESWTKTDQPIFVSSDLTKAYGPGHNSFTVDEAGRDVLVYHARNYRDIVGNSLFDHNRHGRVQPFYFNSAGDPVLGYPVGDGALPVRLENSAGQLLALAEASVAAAETGAAVHGETWEPEPTPLHTVQLIEADANTDNTTVSRTLFRVLTHDETNLLVEPVLARGETLQIDPQEWRIQ